MLDKCLFNNTNKLYANIVLFIIFIIITLYYILFIYKDKKYYENFSEKDGCFQVQQYDMDIDTRKCAVYFIDKDKEKDCDEYFEYYNMSMYQLNNKISETKDKDLYNKLLEIKKFRENNNIKKCKYEFDGWKEINSYHDKYDKSTSNIIYPKKNTTINNYDNLQNFRLWNTCFKETNDTDIKYPENNTVIHSCTKPIKNIRDINSENNEYVSLNFNKPMILKDMYNSICSIITPKDIQIPNNKIFLKYNALFENNSKKYKITDMTFCKYNSSDKKIEDITETRIEDINNIIKNNFIIKYDKNLQQIIYSSKNMVLNSYFLNCDICGNLDSFDISKNIIYNFKDFNIKHKLIDINLLDEVKNELNKLNYDDNTDQLDEIKTKFNFILNKHQTNINNYINQKNKLDKEIKELNSNNINIYNEKQNILSNINKELEIIKKYRQETDNLLKELLINVNKYKTEYERYIESSNLYITRYNEWDTTNRVINKKYDDKILLINQTYKKGCYYNINYYNINNILSSKNPKNSDEFVYYLYNNKPYSYEKGNINTDDINFYNKNNKYISKIKNEINDINNNSYMIIETLCNIKLDKGYYHFVIDLKYEEASEIFLGYKDKNNKFIFKNVANYYYKPDGLRIINGEGTPLKNNENNLTTKYPIYINGTDNNGYYGFYTRKHRNNGNYTIRYLTASYSKITEEQLNNGRYYNVQDGLFEYIPANEISNIKDVNELLYINDNINKDTLNISLYDFKTLSYSIIKNNNLLNWWKFDNNLSDTINSKSFNIINNNSIKYNTYTNIGNYALELSNPNKSNNYKIKVDNINIPNTFTKCFFTNISKNFEGELLTYINDDIKKSKIYYYDYNNRKYNYKNIWETDKIIETAITYYNNHFTFILTESGKIYLVSLNESYGINQKTKEYIKNFGYELTNFENIKETPALLIPSFINNNEKVVSIFTELYSSVEVLYIITNEGHLYNSLTKQIIKKHVLKSSTKELANGDNINTRLIISNDNKTYLMNSKNETFTELSIPGKNIIKFGRVNYHPYEIKFYLTNNGELLTDTEYYMNDKNLKGYEKNMRKELPNGLSYSIIFMSGAILGQKHKDKNAKVIDFLILGNVVNNSLILLLDNGDLYGTGYLGSDILKTSPQVKALNPEYRNTTTWGVVFKIDTSKVGKVEKIFTGGDNDKNGLYCLNSKKELYFIGKAHNDRILNTKINIASFTKINADNWNNEEIDHITPNNTLFTKSSVKDFSLNIENNKLILSSIYNSSNIETINTITETVMESCQKDYIYTSNYYVYEKVKTNLTKTKTVEGITYYELPPNTITQFQAYKLPSTMNINRPENCTYYKYGEAGWHPNKSNVKSCIPPRVETIWTEWRTGDPLHIKESYIEETKKVQKSVKKIGKKWDKCPITRTKKEIVNEDILNNNNIVIDYDIKDKWIHIAYLYNNTSKIFKVYINGNLIKTINNYEFNINKKSINLYLQNNNSNASILYNDMRLFNIELNDDDIKNLNNIIALEKIDYKVPKILETAFYVNYPKPIVRVQEPEAFNVNYDIMRNYTDILKVMNDTERDRKNNIDIYEDNIDDYELQKQGLEEQILANNNLINTKNNIISGLNKNINDMNSKISTLNNQIDNLNNFNSYYTYTELKNNIVNKTYIQNKYQNLIFKDCKLNEYNIYFEV